MAYFAAVVAQDAGSWTAVETELDAIYELADVTDLLRAAMPDDGTALLLVEQEDLWFALVRVDGEEDPRVFVSDESAARRAALGEMLVVAAEDAHAGGVSPERDEDDEDTPVGETSPVGDSELLADRGVSAEDLVALCTVTGALPTAVLSKLAERAGFLDELEALR